MLFNSITFLFYFLPFVIAGSLLIRTNKWRNLFLLIASLVFFAWGEMELLFLLLFCIYVNYYLAILIDKQEQIPKRKYYLILALVFNTGLLAYFKYTNFFIANINQLFGAGIQNLPIILPIGISFYTFHNISYVIDVYKRKIPAQPDLVNIALYIGFFPQLIAGPIIRYVDVAEQLYNRVINSDKMAYGIRRFIIGLAKKVLIANTCANVADQLFALPVTEVHFVSSWLAMLCYTLQIYYDFSGYSDMAIGLGRIFGFEFLENFNFPYTARSMQDFWRRWHISLSSWFRDYVYIPLGGNKVNSFRLYLNLSIVFILTGFWHGASWNFITWGALHGFVLIMERVWLGRQLEKAPAILAHLYTLLVVIFTWVFFRMEDFETALVYCKAMLGMHHGSSYYFNIYKYYDGYFATMFLCGILFISPYKNLQAWITKRTETRALAFLREVTIILILALLFILSVMDIANGTYNPFIYFRF